MARMRQFRRLAFCVGAIVMMNSQVVMAEPVSADISCLPGSGVWHHESDHTVLSGAICTRDGEEGIYRVDFDATSDKHAFAPGISARPGTLKTLDEIGDTIFYADEDNVYAVSRSTYKVMWTEAWSQAARLPKSPDVRLMGIMVSQRGESGDASPVLKVLSVENGRVIEKLSAPMDSSKVLEFVWQPDRLVLVSQDRLTWWPRQGVAFEPMESVELAQPLVDYANARLDDNGLLVIDKPGNSIAYYRFENKSKTQAHLNATATVRGIGGSSSRAVAVTSDLNIVRVVARKGAVLQNRYEAKYWRVRDDAPMILVDGDKLVLDGGEDNRAQSVDASAMTWKRLALMEYRSPGRLALLQDNVLTTIHEGGDEALVRWDIDSGNRISSLPFTAFDAIGGRDQWPRIERVSTLAGMKKYLILELNRPTEKNPDLSFVILDTGMRKLVPEGKVFHAKSKVNGLPSSLSFAENGFVISDEEDGAEWFWFENVDGDGRSVQHRKIGEIPAEHASEMLSAAAKWYGYCYSGENCVVPASNVTSLDEDDTRLNAWKPVETAPKNHQAPIFAWIFSIFSFIAMLGITLWRNGFFAVSKLSPRSTTSSSLSSARMEILDGKNRRFVQERDRISFLSPNFTSRVWFRILMSVLVGAGVALGVTYRFVNDDTMSVFWAWCVILALPVISAVWVLLSWTFWNRSYLLRFGRFVEGEWLNCAKPNQSIAYTTSDGKTFELSRHQWKRVDFVPVVLYDPNRPQFAIQYTGDTNYAMDDRLTMAANKLNSCSFDSLRLGVMMLVLVGCIGATQLLFGKTYPNPLSVWELDSIKAEQGAFVTACLDECSKDGCFKQCQNRQMRMVYDDAGYSISTDPEVTPSKVLEDAHVAMAAARDIIVAPNETCHAKVQKLQSVAIMPENLSRAFWKVYAQKDAYALSDIDATYKAVQADVRYLEELCDEAGTCARDASSCPEPPTCFGSASLLKSQLCSFARELKIPAGLD